MPGFISQFAFSFQGPFLLHIHVSLVAKLIYTRLLGKMRIDVVRDDCHAFFESNVFKTPLGDLVE